MKQKFISIKKIVMPVMQALILVSSLTGCAVKQADFAELMNEADNLNVELAIGQLDETSKNVTVYMPSFGINNLKNQDDNAAATQFKDAFGKLKPATTLMGVMTGNNGDTRYFMVPGTAASNQSSSEFVAANQAAEQLYTHISPDVFKKTPDLEGAVKAAIASSIYYNTWSSTFVEDSSEQNSVASGYVETSINKVNMLTGVFNTVFGSDNIPGDDSLYGEATADMIAEFESRLSGAAESARQTGTKQGEALANSIDAFLDSSDAENSIRKLMYIERFTDVDYVSGNPDIESNEDIATAESGASANQINSAQVLFENATKIDALEVIYNIVREYDSDFSTDLADKDYEDIAVADVTNTEFKDLDGSDLTVKGVDELYDTAVTKADGQKVETSRSKESVAREYQGVMNNNDKNNGVLTAGQWEMYNDAATNTSILTNLNSKTTKDLSLVSDMQVTDLYLMLLGASHNIDNGYNTGLETAVINTGVTDTGNSEDVEYNFAFDVHVENYKYANDVTDEDLRNNQDTRYAMYEEIYLSGYDPDDARSDQEAGCTNEFLAGFLDYVQVRNTTGFNSETETTDENVDKNSPEYIKKAYNQEGQTISDWMKSQGVYTDQDGVIRWPNGSPVTFDDPDDLPEGFTFEASPEDNKNVMTEEERQATQDANDGKDPELNAVIDQLYKEGYFN